MIVLVSLIVLLRRLLVSTIFRSGASLYTLPFIHFCTCILYNIYMYVRFVLVHVLYWVHVITYLLFELKQSLVPNLHYCNLESDFQ